ncbi:hypothetical protein MIND_00358000 [Mycena indigotica]|uniref:Uncharacterized protein n=1 Tax=Mycena indigotica TaxID=2126181 RepID=A0A8H6T2U5_9AGAR|nr:uncharacterized protein MIND_00358000 [Mycena indigotica]KAF7309859.1 hypothetical protein MIND_00358000 [Mycena indigotica]
MILPDDKLDGIPLDAPPAYEASTSSSAPSDTKRPSPVVTTTSNSNSSAYPPLKSAPPSSASWFGFASPASRQVRSTVLGLVRDLVKQADEGEASAVVTSSILKSCSDACSANGLSIGALLQEPSVEGHTPLYWAIIKRPPENPSSSPTTDLLTTLLSLSTPLTPATIAEIRLACLLTSDQALFQRLRSSPDFSPLSPTDQLILDASIPPDAITVENVPHDEFAFAVDVAIVRFQTRMRVGKHIELDFIARGRMWRLAFHVSERRRAGQPPPGTWFISLGLLEGSPPTWIDSRLLVPAPIDALLTPPSQGFGSGFFGPGKPRPRPTLSVRLKAPEQLYSTGRHRRSEIVVVLDDGDSGLGTLQYAGCPYIQPDESLQLRLEARLARPEADCVIC